MGFAGNPIPGVDVDLQKNPGGSIVFTGQTGKDGKFACELKEGKYKLNISYSQIERILQNVIGFAAVRPAEFKIDNKMVDNIEISLLLYSKSTNAKENIIAKTSVDKESGALSINIPKGGALISGIISYELKSDGNNTSNDLKNIIITQQPDSPKDTIPSLWSVVCYSAAGTTTWRCGAIKGGCDRLYGSTAYFYSGADRWLCNEYPIVLTNPDIPILLNREKDGRASLSINGEITPIASDDFESLLTKMETEDRNAESNSVRGDVSTTRSLSTGTSGKTNAKDDKKRNEIETFMKNDKGMVSDKRLCCLLSKICRVLD